MIRALTKTCLGTAGVARSIELPNVMAAKLKVNFLVLRWAALLVSQAPYRRKNGAGTLSFRSGKESFGSKKLLELVWTLVYVV